MVRASLLAFCLLGALLLVMPAVAYPSLGNYYRPGVQYEPEQIMDMLNRLNELMEMERKMENSEKRALDMGLNRGYSGALHAKHLMGMAAANYASGPGRRRRDVE
ncbi:diuretic hormone class 2 isoform X3 [Vanessa tameamea]|uniref:Diuretic hormone class 2 isoform X3 n=1 Tax=Vanessa tameamea TaxID=334116 RepID=A0A8B8IN90_VANTA|nr:diuretic hormone class 2 isoform X3 [Vanessa tameamea]XP_046977916.1 diuretic hormone class 2 isoform X3 [Vanessa cardui]